MLKIYMMCLKDVEAWEKVENQVGQSLDVS